MVYLISFADHCSAATAGLILNDLWMPCYSISSAIQSSVSVQPQCKGLMPSIYATIIMIMTACGKKYDCSHCIHHSVATDATRTSGFTLLESQARCHHHCPGYSQVGGGSSLSYQTLHVGTRQIKINCGMQVEGIIDQAVRHSHSPFHLPI